MLSIGARKRGFTWLPVALMAALIFSPALTALAQPEWQPSGTPSTGTINGSEWTTVTETRGWTREDGTRVTETRYTTTKKTDGKTEFKEVETITKEENGDDKSETRVKEKTDSSGKKTSIEQKFTEKKTPEGKRRTTEYKKDGKLEGTTTTNYFDPPRADGTYMEEESISYDKDGKPIKKVKTRYLKTGIILIDEYVWDPKTGTWVQSGGTKVIEAKPPKVVAPSTSTAGVAVGGTTSQEGVKATTGGIITAESTKGENKDIEFSIDGGWKIPEGFLTAGFWLLSAVLPDGSKGLPEILQVLPASSGTKEPSITGAPGLSFLGSTLTLLGRGFLGLDGHAEPTVWLSGQGDPVSLKPAAYSDTELVCSIPAGTGTGEVSVFVNNGSSFSNPVRTNLVSFDIIVPQVTKVGQKFIVTVSLTGLSGDYLKKEFTALLTITGPARFISNMGKEGTVVLKGGLAQVEAIAEEPGSFDITGSLSSIP